MKSSRSVQRTSPWFDQVPDNESFSVLSGNHDADVVVIGGGISGILTAWQCARAGKRVIVLEKNLLATGDTGFTTAFLTRIPDVGMAQVEKTHDIAFAKRVITSAKDAQKLFIDTIREEAIDCDLVECDSYIGSYKVGDARLMQEWEALRDTEPDASWMSADEISRAHIPFAEAIRVGHEGRFHIRKFLTALLKTDRAKEFIKVYERTEVVGIDTSSDKIVEITTAAGRIRASHVVVATGSPAGLFPELSSLVTGTTTYAVALRYADHAPISDHLYWDVAHPEQYYRLFDDRTVILGGQDQVAGQRSKRDPFLALEIFWDRLYPDHSYQRTHQWSGSLFTTSDGLPVFDQHPLHRRVWFITGLSGTGMVYSMLGSMVIAHALFDTLPHPGHDLFSLKRLGFSVDQTLIAHAPASSNSASAPGTRSLLISLLRYTLPLVPLLLIWIPWHIFFVQRGGTAFLGFLDFKTFNLAIFPLFGLYAFFLLYFQFMVGSSMDLLRKVYPNIERLHRFTGPIVLLLALTHPTLIFLGVGLSAYIHFQFVAPSQRIFVLLGEFQLTLLVTTVSAGLLRKTKFLKRYWHRIHLLNYVVFASVWTHSWFLGSDVRTTSLRYLWMFYGVTAVISVGLRVWREIKKHHRVPLSHQSTGAASQPKPDEHTSYVRVAAARDVQEGIPFCAEVSGKKIAVFRIADKVYAIDNTCTHAGGSLCEGTLEGTEIECPLHASRFDVRSGEVKQGPALDPVRAYPARVNVDAIEVAISE